jgi:hypothetical protein
LNPASAVSSIYQPFSFVNGTFEKIPATSPLIAMS